MIPTIFPRGLFSDVPEFFALNSGSRAIVLKLGEETCREMPVYIAIERRTPKDENFGCQYDDDRAEMTC